MELTKLKKLTDKLNTASQLYYNGEDSGMTNVEFDLELKELQRLEKELNIVFPHSPTQRVGSDLRDEFGKIEHPEGFPMLTIENVYSDEDFIEWLRKMFKEYNATSFNVSLKYDGISCELYYANGVLATGSTRGDKLVGDNITENVRTIKSVPLTINVPKDHKTDIYVRGEILLPKSSLVEINRKREEEGLKLFANCRNACSGSVKQLDSRITAERNLIFRPWDIFSPNEEFQSATQSAKYTLLKEMGFNFKNEPTSFDFEFSEPNIPNILTLMQDIWEKAKNQDYDCDGIVVKINDTNIQSEIGTKDNRAIEWGIARKWNEENICETDLIGVDWQVGRTGHVTPVGKLEPVECDGVTISNVTLNNVKFIETLDLHRGYTLKITRSGGVIPYVLGSSYDIAMALLGAYPKIEIPTKCPICGTELIRDGEYLKCPNKYGCAAQIEGRIEQWCSKDCMDIAQVGEALIHDLVEKDLVEDPVDLYDLPRDFSAQEMANILGSGYGTKSMKTFLDNIKKSQWRTFDKVLYGLSIEGIGKQNAKLLAQHFGSYQSLYNASIEELMEVEGIGPNLAQNIKNWFETIDPDLRYWERLFEAGLKLTMESDGVVAAQENQVLAGLNIVFTGKSANWDGDEVEEVFTAYGAKCGHSISKKTNYLVTGENPGPSKVSKAKTMGLEIISESDFIKKYNIPTEKEFVFPDDLENHEEVSQEEALW